MRRMTIWAVLLIACAAPLSAQQLTSEQYKAKYLRQARVVGASGLGIETILDNWAGVDPDNPDMLEARFRYYFDKSRSTQAVIKDMDRYLGEKPVLSLPDTSGRTVNFFEETFFDDSLFALGMKAIDRAVSVKPDELDYRFQKIAALLSYEKESPDLACGELKSLIMLDHDRSPEWMFRGEAPEDGLFKSAVQEYCYSFFHIASEQSYNMFLEVSEMMVKLNPKDTVFLSNIGSYWLVARKDHKKARKYYDKVLKINPKDYSALKNCVIMARTDRNVKLEKKYLPALIEVTESDSERLSAKARLEYLEGGE